MTKAQDKSIPNERWLPVVGYEGWYEVSDHGRVRRKKPGGGSFINKILRSAASSRGYLHVDLYKHGKNKICSVHRLVVESFIGPYPKGFETNHIDGVKTNNCLANLECVSSSQNKIHAPGFMPDYGGFEAGMRSRNEIIGIINRIRCLKDN